MAFKKLETSNSLKDVPMLSDYLESLSPKELKKIQGSIFVVNGICIAKSGKGYMLNFVSFCVFLFKKSSQAELLREYLADDTIGTPCIEIDSEQKYGFYFGLDDEIISRVNYKTEAMIEVIQVEKLSSTELPLKEEF